MRWKPIKGYEGLYEISDCGKVKSLSKLSGSCVRKEKLRSISLTKCGYPKVTLCVNKKYKTFRVHRLVAEHFLKKPTDSIKNTVNHIDGVKTNNNYKNLEWNNRSEQLKHAYDLGLKKAVTGIDNVQAKLSEKAVKDIRKNCIKNSRTHGTIAFSKKYNVSNRVIGLVLNNKSYKNVK